MLFLPEKSYFYGFEIENNNTRLLFNWKNFSQINPSYTNFFFLNIKNHAFFDSSTFIQNNNNFFTNFQLYESANMDTEQYVPIVNNDFFNEENIFENFLNIRKFSFISFFINNLLDVPICFRKSKSLKTKNFELFFLKFSNLLMRKGKREKTIRDMLGSFFHFFDKIEEEKFKQKIYIFNWFDLFLMTTNKINLFNDKNWVALSNEETISLRFAHSFFLNEKEFEISSFIKNLLYTHLTQLSPMFTYFIYNVDKNIRKYTRGKSGKYTFVWKYLAPYKRKYLVFRWFLKELKFDENRRLQSRLISMFNKIVFNLNQTHAWRIKNYTYAFIFKNFRKTFMTNLKTVSK